MKKNYSEEELMELQLTDMGAYLRAISSMNNEDDDYEKPKTAKKHHREKFPKEFNDDYADVDDIYRKGKKKKYDDYDYDFDYDQYSGNDFINGADDDEPDGIAAIYTKKNKKAKKRYNKKMKRNYSDYYDDYIDEFSDPQGPMISDKEVIAYKAIRTRINRLEEGTLPVNEYDKLVKLCAVIAKLHTTEPEDDYEEDDSYNYDYDDDKESENDSSPEYITVGNHIGNQEIEEDSDDADEEDDEDDEEESDEEEEVVQVPLESIFYVRYNTDYDRMAINSQYVSLNVAWGSTPYINQKTVTPHAEAFTSLDEVHEFVRKYLVPYMCSHMHPNLVVKRVLFDTAKTNYKFDKNKYIFIARGEYVNCYYIDPVQYKCLQDGIEILATNYSDITPEDGLANALLVIMNMIAELYRDPASIYDEEYAAICTDDELTSNSANEKFWKRFYGDRTRLNTLPNSIPIETVDYEEIQTAMFMFVSEWKEEDGDSYKDLDDAFSASKPSEVLANSVVMSTDPEAADIVGSDIASDVDIVEPEVVDVDLSEPIPVHR